MDLNVIYDIHFFIESKERGTFQTYAELDRIYNLGQLDLLNEYIDESALNGKIHNALEPFKKDLTVTALNSVGGKITLPTDYILLTPACYTTPNYGEIRFYNESEWVNAIKSQLRPATTTKPAAKIIDGEIELFPKSTITGIVNYIRKPVAPVFVYTQSGPDNRTINYDQGGSTQLEWDDLYITKVIMHTLTYVGVNLNEAQITAYAEQKNKQSV